HKELVVEKRVEGEESVSISRMARRHNPLITHLEVGHEELIGRRFNREDESAFAPALFRFLPNDLTEAVEERLHSRIHPLARRRRVSVIAGKARKGGTADVLIEKLHPVQSVIQKPADKVVRDLPRLGNAEAARVAWAPGSVPVLLPELLIVGAANRLLPLMISKKLLSLISRPEVPCHPARSVAEGADMPSPLARHSAEITQRLIAARRRETIRIEPGPGPFPGHDDGNKRRLNSFRDLLKQGNNLGIRQEFRIRLSRTQIQLTLDANNDMGRRIQQPVGHVLSLVQRGRRPVLLQRPLAIKTRGVIPVSFKTPQDNVVPEFPLTVRGPIPHMCDAQPNPSCTIMDRLDQFDRSGIILAAHIETG